MTLVVIQRGHYPRTFGATGAPGEQDYAVKTSNLLAAQLREAGFEARVINADEPMVMYRGDIFVALHYDSASSDSASGASVGWQTSAGNRLAQLWKRAYAERGWNRGFRDDNYTTNLREYYGVRNAVSVGNKAAIITEAGFHTNVHDRALINPQLTAVSIVDAIKEYTGWKEPVPVVTPRDFVTELFKTRIPNAIIKDDAPTFQSWIAWRFARLYQWGREIVLTVRRLEAKLDAVAEKLDAHADVPNDEPEETEPKGI